MKFRDKKPPRNPLSFITGKAAFIQPTPPKVVICPGAVMEPCVDGEGVKCTAIKSHGGQTVAIVYAEMVK